MFSSWVAAKDGVEARTNKLLSLLQMNMDPQTDNLPPYFNSAEKWPGKIHEPLDQGNCAASWAFSTAGAVLGKMTSVGLMGELLGNILKMCHMQTCMNSRK